jgi:hypothetical protein
MTIRISMVMAVMATLAACGGLEGVPAQAATGAARGGGGTTATTPTTNPLPTSPPAPDIVLRESFGLGPSWVRPAGGNGALKSATGSLDGFWVEWPGSASEQWSSADGGWTFAGCSTDPLELPSPLQTNGNGCTVSSWADGIVRFPDALVPFAGLAGTYELSADVIPAMLPGAAVGIGFTGSNVTTGNLRAAGQLWLLVTQGPQPDGVNAVWQLRAGDLASGAVVATGSMLLSGYDPVALRYDPVAGAASVTVNGVASGPYAVAGVAPRYVAIEGQGVLDDLVVRSIP